MKRILKLALLLFTVALITASAMAAVSVSVSPASAQVNLGQQFQFTANVSGTSLSVVIWSVTGPNCSGNSCGQITSDGVYTAPLVAPSPAVVTVRATSLADTSKSGTASVTVGTPAKVSVSISPTSATVGVNGQQQFFASVTGSGNTAVKWTVSGAGCVGGSCGSISPSGLYTAPGTIPNPSFATVTATSVADPSKSAAATVIIKSATSITISISPTSAQVTTGAQQQFTASVQGSTNTSVTWRVTGTGCSGATCGTISASGLYTAPGTVPNPAKVTVTATAVAEPSRSASASVTLVQGAALSVSPGSVSLKPGAQQQFTALSSGRIASVTWSISGSGCVGFTCGSINSSGLYIAPATAPTPPTVIVTARLLSNPSVSGSATVTIQQIGAITVTVSPRSVNLGVGGKQQFTALVQGTSNTAVTWSVTGFGCGGSDCGTITPGGLYTAPATQPNPNFVSVTATSVADPTRRDSATVTITQQIAVNISPLSAQVAPGGQQQFTAKVTGTPNTGVTFTVTGAGCTGVACGTISPSGLYTAPGTIPNPATITITAVANVDGFTSATATVTINVPIIVTVIPTSSIVSVNQQEQFRATVEGTANTAVTWSISGAGCTGSACGSITATGLYTAPGTVPNPATVKVTATSAANASRSGSATVTIAPSNNVKLTGPYAFQFSGFDARGVYQSAGSFTADGQGHLTKGLEDINNTNGPSTSVTFTGTYVIGNDNRGTMTFTTASGGHTFRFAVDTLGKKGRFIEFDSTGVRGSGIIKRQDPTAFDPSAFTGGYVFSLAGMETAGLRIGALGLIFPDGSGFISGSSLDVNDGGQVSPTFATFNGLYSVEANGRGTMTLAVPGFAGGVFNFAFYVVSANEFLLQSIDIFSDSNPIFNGPAEIQTGAPFLTSALKGPAVFDLNGANGNTVDDTVGRFLFDGNGNVTAAYDQNKGGQITIAGQFTGADSVELNGRATLNLNNPTTGQPTIWYIYATAPNQGFLMDASTGSVGIGELKNQLETPPSFNSDILGTYFFASGEPTVSTAPLFSGVSSFDGGSNILGQGSVSGTEDVSKSSGNTAGLALSGKYTVSHVSNNGRGTILQTLPSGETIAVWVISANEVIGLDVDSTETQPTVLHFQQ